MFLGAEHTHRVSLHHTHAVVVVDDKTREVVAFSVNEAIAVCGGDCHVDTLLAMTY